jgi:hypothetical protein
LKKSKLDSIVASKQLVDVVDDEFLVSHLHQYLPSSDLVSQETASETTAAGKPLQPRPAAVVRFPTMSTIRGYYLCNPENLRQIIQHIHWLIGITE